MAMYKTNEGCFDMKNRTKKVLSLAIIGMMLLTGAAGCSTGADANNEESNAIYTAKMYVGLNDAGTDSQALTIEEAQQMVRKIITDKGFGYTEYVANGAYIEDDGTVVDNDTLVYELFFMEKEEAHAIAKEVKAALHLKSVLMGESTAEYNFVTE